MTESLGTISGQVRLDVRQALAAYAAVRASNAATVFSLRGASKAFLLVGTASAAAGVALLAVFAKAVGAAATFQKKIDFFGAITKATQDDMDAVAKKALDMGKTTIFSADKMADAFVAFGKAGISTHDILNGMADAVVNLAQASDIDLNTATNILVATMSTFGVKAAGATKVVDLLAGAANASIIDVDDLGVSLKYVGGIAAATGVPLKSVVTAIALLGQAGIRGSTAGTSLRQILVSLNATSGKSRKELRDLGIITGKNNNLFIDARGHLKPLAEVFDILRTHTAKLTDAQRLSALKIIFNNRALAAANILLKDGSKGFADMAANIDKVKAADVARKRLDNLAGDITRLKNTFQTLFIQAGLPFQNMMRQIVQGLTAAAKWFGNLSPGIQSAVFWFVLITGVLLTFLGVFAIVSSVVLRSIEGWILLRQAMALSAGGLKALIVGFRALSVALLTNPVFLIIAALVALVVIFVLLYKHSARFRDIVQATGRAMLTAWRAVINFFKPVAAFFKGVWDKIKAGYDASIGPLTTAFGVLISVGQTVINFFKKFGIVILGIMFPFISIPILIITHFSQIIDFFRALPGRILSFLVALPGRMLALGLSLMKSLLTGFINALPGIIVFFALLPLRIIAFFLKADLWLLNVGVKIFFGLLTGMRNGLVRHIIPFLIAFVPKLLSFWVHANVWLLKAGIAILKGLWRGNIEGNKIVFNFLNSLPGKIIRIFGAAIGWLRSAGASILRGLYNGIVAGATAVISWFRSLPGKIPGYLGDASNLLYQVGRDIIQGLINGIGSMVSSIVSAAANIGHSVLNGIKSVIKGGSPSYEAHLLGMSVGEGMANGINATMSQTNAAAVRMAEGILDNTQKTLSSLEVNPPVDFVGSIEKQLPELARVMTQVNDLITATTIPVNAGSNMALAAGNVTINNNITNSKSAVVNNPPPVPGEQQVIDAFRKMDALFGAAVKAYV